MDEQQAKQPEPASQPTGENSQSKPASGQQNTAMAVVAYIIFFIPLLTDAKNDPFVKYHVKQGLGLLLCWVAVSIIFTIVPLIGTLLEVALVVLWIIGIINAVGGKKAPLPLVGTYFEKFSF